MSNVRYVSLVIVGVVLVVMRHSFQQQGRPPSSIEVPPPSPNGGIEEPRPPPPPPMAPPTVPTPVRPSSGELRFIRYESSAYERYFPAWHNNRPCDALMRNANLRHWNERYVELLPKCCVRHQPLPPPSNCDTVAAAAEKPIDGLPADVFSYMVYAKSGGGEWRVPIEPIAGVLRHPALCNRMAAARPHHVDFGAVVDKGYFVVDPFMVRRAPGRRILFDVGGSTWNDGPGGASQKFFYDLFREMCVPFDEYYVWEATPLPPNVVDRVPPELRPHYHWYNVLASAEALNDMNPFNKLREVVTERDYVVVKLDIDNGPVETRLVDQLLVDPRLWSLVDEFFFEHHVHFEPMTMYWGGSAFGTMNDSLRIFRSLRERGIRAHSWV